MTMGRFVSVFPSRLRERSFEAAFQESRAAIHSFAFYDGATAGCVSVVRRLAGLFCSSRSNTTPTSMNTCNVEWCLDEENFNWLPFTSIWPSFRSLIMHAFKVFVEHPLCLTFFMIYSKQGQNLTLICM